MEESDQPEEKKEMHPTKALTSEPQEEFIEPKARPSEDESDADLWEARRTGSQRSLGSHTR
jgi:hypothetical protein